MTQPLQVQDWPVEKLIPYARNARTHSDEQLAQIAASIREFGFTNPILVDSAAGIIAGHGRLSAARKLRLETVPVIVLDHLTETQKRAYILADNKLALNAGWDNALLALEFEDLKLDGFELELTGFSDAEIEALGESTDADGNSPSESADGERKTLSERFLIPPFSVLDARQGYWQDRKRQWLSLGIKSELGRGGNALDMSASMAGITDPAERDEWNQARRSNQGADARRA